MQKRTISIQKTARFYQLGNLDSNTKKVWIAFHGYGMLAEYFGKKIEVLTKENEDTCVLIPEGLSRFYLKGTGGRVGASWMTKDDREVDIQDNMLYLDNICQHVQQELGTSDFELSLMGFSQGAPTACRWFHYTHIHVDHLVVWGSDIPSDTLSSSCIEKWNTTKVILVIGTEDQYISEERKNGFLAQLNIAGIHVEVIEYQGDHRIFPTVLKSISDKL